jgi:hypothetical protein
MNIKNCIFCDEILTTQNYSKEKVYRCSNTHHCSKIVKENSNNQVTYYFFEGKLNGLEIELVGEINNKRYKQYCQYWEEDENNFDHNKLIFESRTYLAPEEFSKDKIIEFINKLKILAQFQ